jgi:hypothetical protein
MRFTTKLSGILALLAGLAASGMAQAQVCSGLSAQLDDVRAYYRDIDENTALEKALEAIKLVRAGLTNAANSAFDCRCNSVSTELLTSASFARQAEATTTTKAFMYEFNRSILSYNSALELLRHCNQR